MLKFQQLCCHRNKDNSAIRKVSYVYESSVTGKLIKERDPHKFKVVLSRSMQVKKMLGPTLEINIAKYQVFNTKSAYELIFCPRT